MPPKNTNTHQQQALHSPSANDDGLTRFIMSETSQVKTRQHTILTEPLDSAHHTFINSFAFVCVFSVYRFFPISFVHFLFFAPIRNVALFFLLRYFCMMFNVHAMRPSRCVYVNSITTTQPFGMTFSNINSILSLSISFSSI